MAITTKRRFTDEFKREAVALWETSGRMQTEVAAELGIMPTMLRRWQRKLGDGIAVPASPAAKPPVSAMASPADQASEIARLRRELDRARMERDILKKPSASLRRCRGEVRLYRAACVYLAGERHVPQCSACRAAAITTGVAGHRARERRRTWRCSAMCVGSRRAIRGATGLPGCMPPYGRKADSAAVAASSA